MFKDIVMQRYATKQFSGEIIPEETIQQLIELIRFAPSSFNLQPWKLKVVKDAETKEKLLGACMNQPQVTSCSHLLVFCTDTRTDHLIDELEKQMLKDNEPEKVSGFISMIKGFVSNIPAEYHLPWHQRQIYLALGNALNGAKSLGFDSCPIEGFVPEQVADILNIPKHLVPTVLCPVGIAADTARPKVRYNTNDILIE